MQGFMTILCWFTLFGIPIGVCALPELAGVEAKLEEGKARLQVEREKQIGQLNERYLAGLEKLEKGFASQGDPSAASLVRSERSRFATRGSVLGAPEFELEPLLKLRNLLLEQITIIDVRQNAAMVELFKQYSQTLYGLQTGFKKEGRNSDVKRVQAALDRAFEDADYLAASRGESKAREKLWKVLLRSKRPRFWNTERNNGDGYAVSLSAAPNDIRYLRLRRMDTKEFVIIPITKESLKKRYLPASGGYGWMGENSEVYGRLQLGIFDASELRRNEGDVVVARGNQYDTGYPGYGFGYVIGKYPKKPTPVYIWNKSALRDPVGFEFAVTAHELTPGERKFLLAKRPTSNAKASRSIAIPTKGFVLWPKDAARSQYIKLVDRGAGLIGFGGREVASFALNLVKPGRYHVELVYSSSSSSSVQFECKTVHPKKRFGTMSGQKRDVATQGRIKGTAEFDIVRMGVLELNALMRMEVRMTDAYTSRENVVVRGIRLVPAS